MERTKLNSIAGLWIVLVLTTAAVEAVPKSTGKDSKPKAAQEKLEPYECGKVKRLHTLGGAFLASQPQPEDFETAKEAGIKTIVNLRHKEELDWDEAALIKKLGLEYHNVPFKSPKSLTDDVFAQVREILNEKSKRPLILHCASANRVGAIWLAHRVLDGGLSYDDALAEAKTVGLKLPAYEEKAKVYITRHQK